MIRNPDAEQHRGFQGDLSSPHGADPVEQLHPGRHGDEEGHERKERQQNSSGGVHVVRPHRDRERCDAEGGEDQALVAEDGFAAEDREDFGDDAEERERDDVDLGMAEEPEQVLPEHRSPGRRVEHVTTEVSIEGQPGQRGREGRERQQYQHRGHEYVPGEDRHPEHRHAGCAQAHHGGDEVDRTQDRAQAGQDQTQYPQVGTDTGGMQCARQWGVGGPSEVRGTSRSDEPGEHDQRPEDIQPVRERVEARERYVGCADL